MSAQAGTPAPRLVGVRARRSSALLVATRRSSPAGQPILRLIPCGTRQVRKAKVNPKKGGSTLGKCIGANCFGSSSNLHAAPVPGPSPYPPQPLCSLFAAAPPPATAPAALRHTAHRRTGNKDVGHRHRGACTRLLRACACEGALASAATPAGAHAAPHAQKLHGPHTVTRIAEQACTTTRIAPA